jgi:hypothetical protein
LLLVGAIIAVIEAFFFIGTESGDALEVARVHPAWGGYVLLLVLAVVGLMVRWWLLRIRQNGVVINIDNDQTTSTTPQKVGRGFYSALIGLLVIGSVGAVLWLSRIAATSSQ